MNQDYEKWLKTERKYWSSQNYRIRNIENGFEVESIYQRKHVVSWEPFLYELVKKEFQLTDNVFTYSSQENTLLGQFAHYFIDFLFKDIYFRFAFHLNKNNIEYRVYYSKKDFIHVSNSFKDLDMENVLYLHQQLTNLFKVISKIPVYRVKIALKELHLLTPEENLCKFDEYYLQYVKEKTKEGSEK